MCKRQVVTYLHMCTRPPAGELRCDIPIIISNHPDLQHIADMFNVPFRCLPLKGGDKAGQVGAWRVGGGWCCAAGALAACSEGEGEQRK